MNAIIMFQRIYSIEMVMLGLSIVIFGVIWSLLPISKELWIKVKEDFENAET